MPKSYLSIVALAVASLCWTPAQASFPYETSGKAVAYAMPAVAFGVAAYHKDWKGVAQLTVVTGLTYGAAYALKQIVRSCRPYAKIAMEPHCAGGAWDSFPSTTSALASGPSSFVWNRYGWEWGVPLFVVSKYPSWALQKSHQNKLWDGLATTGIAWGLNQIFTTRYHSPDMYARRGVYTDFDSDEQGRLLATVGYRW